MKKTSFLLGLLAVSYGSFAQGWIGVTPNSLTPVNSSLGLTPLDIGIGTNTPTEQLHTTLGVRFEGLTNDNTQKQVLVQDGTGKLFWRDASTIGGGGSFWSLLGDAGTSPSTNFLGTTDFNDLSFRTNNTEKMRITATGRVGIGLATPDAQFLHAGTGQLTGITGGPFPYVAISGDDNFSAVDGGMLALVNTGTWGKDKGGEMIFAGKDNYSPTHIATFARINGKKEDATSGQWSGYLSFETRQSPAGLAERVRITSNGRVGIATTAPTSLLHVKCANIGTPSDVRFENLPAGEGNILVIDANGYVYKASQTAKKGTSPDEAMQRIAALEQEIHELKALLAQQGASGSVTDKKEGYLAQNAPNPFTIATTIAYGLPAGVQKAAIGVYDMNGRELKLFPLSTEPTGTITIHGSELAPGMYLYTLIVDGRPFDSKKMVLTSE